VNAGASGQCRARGDFADGRRTSDFEDVNATVRTGDFQACSDAKLHAAIPHLRNEAIRECFSILRDLNGWQERMRQTKPSTEGWRSGEDSGSWGVYNVDYT